jgi:RHS repeat-associated protein
VDRIKYPLVQITIFLAFLIVSLPVCFANEIKITYDANGNVVSDGQFYREYNGANQLYRIRNGTTASSPIYQEYTYDPIEERVVLKKTYTMAGAVKETVIYFSQDYVRVINSSGTFDFEYAYLDGQMIAQINPGGTKLFMETDQKGDIVAVTNASGKVIENTSYSPFGEVLTGGKASRFGYEAQEHDTVIGDTDFHARKYSPSMGIFLQPDSLIQNEYDPQSLNHYMFERGNSYKNNDPNGHFIVVAVLIVEGLLYLGIGILLIKHISEGGSYPGKGIDDDIGISGEEGYPPRIDLDKDKKINNLEPNAIHAAKQSNKANTENSYTITPPIETRSTNVNECNCQVHESYFAEHTSPKSTWTNKPSKFTTYINIQTGNKLEWYGDSGGPKTKGYIKK